MTRDLINLMLIVALTTVLLPLRANAEFYQYEDENGSVSFTDNPANVPKKLKKKRMVREDDISSPAPPSSPADSGLTRFRFVNNQILVPVTIGYNGQEVQATFLLDTGANTCTISPTLARRLNIKPRDAKAGLTQVVGGQVYLVGSVVLDHVIVGPHKRYEIKATVIPGAGYGDGLLGMNFLKGLRYRIDFDAYAIKWGD